MVLNHYLFYACHLLIAIFQLNTFVLILRVKDPQVLWVIPIFLTWARFATWGSFAIWSLVSVRVSIIRIFSFIRLQLLYLLGRRCERDAHLVEILYHVLYIFKWYGFDTIQIWVVTVLEQMGKTHHNQFLKLHLEALSVVFYLSDGVRKWQKAEVLKLGVYFGENSILILVDVIGVLVLVNWCDKYRLRWQVIGVSQNFVYREKSATSGQLTFSIAAEWGVALVNCIVVNVLLM